MPEADLEPAGSGDSSLRTNRVILALPFAIALGHALLFVGYLVDDAYISFRYARNLAGGAGLVYNAGAHVEGYTNFSWVMLIAAADALGIAPTWFVPIAGLLSLMALIAVVLRIGRALNPTSRWAGIPAALIVGCYVATAFYAVTGLETVFFALWMALSAGALLQKRAVPFAVFTSLAFLTRPEAALIGIAGAGMFVARAARGQSAIRRETRNMLLVFAALIAPYLAFKLVYFGGLLPNTLFAKQPDLAFGLSYLERSWPLLPIWVLAAAAARRHRQARWLLALAVAYTIALVCEGGDWMPAHRLIVPYLAFLALAADVFLTEVRAPRSRAWVAALTALLLVYVGAQAFETKLLARSAVQTEALDENRIRFAEYLRAHCAPSVAAHDIGLLGYELRDTQIVDLGGLVDPEIAHGAGGYGTKRPDSKYLARVAPACVVIASGPPQRERSGELRVVPLFPVEEYVQHSEWLHKNYVHDNSFALGPHYFAHVFVAAGRAH
jgi:hypothetical protein